MIISILNQKGGTGKTTLSVNLAAAFALEGERVLLIDADQQGSALDWAAARSRDPLFTVVGIPKKTVHREVAGMQRNYGLVVIDGPPRINDVARSAIYASDLVLIPVQPSPLDVWSAKEIIDLLDEAAAFKEKLKHAFVVNRKIVNTAIGRDVVEALAGYKVPVLPSHVCQRVAFAESAALGSTVVEQDLHGPAGTEIIRLRNEIRRLML